MHRVVKCHAKVRRLSNIILALVVISPPPESQWFNVYMYVLHRRRGLKTASGGMEYGAECLRLIGFVS